jgi:hypothetical protein
MSYKKFCFVVTEVKRRLVYEQGSQNFVGARNSYSVDFISCTISTLETLQYVLMETVQN